MSIKNVEGYNIKECPICKSISFTLIDIIEAGEFIYKKCYCSKCNNEFHISYIPVTTIIFGNRSRRAKGKKLCEIIASNIENIPNKYDCFSAGIIYRDMLITLSNIDELDEKSFVEEENGIDSTEDYKSKYESYIEELKECLIYLNLYLHREIKVEELLAE